MGVLDHVPDLIREIASNSGVENAAFNSNTPGSFEAVSTELKQAYASGDYTTIQKYTDQASNDLLAIYGNIQTSEEAAFFQLTNSSDKTPYWLSIAGPASDPIGYMWFYTAPFASSAASSESAGGSAPITQPVIQIGTFSKNAQTLGISNTILDSNFAQLTAGAIATVFATVVSKFLARRIGGMLVAPAVEAAIAAGGIALVNGQVLAGILWRTIATLLASAIGFAVVGAVVFYLVMFIANVVFKNYKVCVNIYNWDLTQAYLISSDWALDNAKIDGGTSAQEIQLPSASSTVTMPDGMVVPAPNSIYQYASLVFDNDSTFMQGLGVALRVETIDQSTGFQLKYLCSYTQDNAFGLTGGITSSSVTAYYDDASTWAANGSYNAQAVIPIINVPISCTTPSLSGRSDQFYEFDVHIGLQPNADFDEPQEPPPKEKPLLPSPDKAIVPDKGDLVTMPNGMQLEVTGKMGSWSADV